MPALVGVIVMVGTAASVVLVKRADFGDAVTVTSSADFESAVEMLTPEPAECEEVTVAIVPPLTVAK